VGITVQHTRRQEYFFDLARSSAQDQDPDGQGGKRHRDILGNAEQLHGGRHARKFGTYVTHINYEAGKNEKKRRPETKFFPDQIGKPLPRYDAHASAHFFGNVEGDGHGNERPEQRVAVHRSGLRIDRDSAGIVVHIGGDDARTDDGEK
jgi:hypothetical protein